MNAVVGDGCQTLSPVIYHPRDKLGREWRSRIMGHLVVGVLVGTYSSIYVAANALLLMGVEQKDLLVPEKEGQDQDALL